MKAFRCRLAYRRHRPLSLSLSLSPSPSPSPSPLQLLAWCDVSAWVAKRAQ
jgi:hypothetical protein